MYNNEHYEKKIILSDNIQFPIRSQTNKLNRKVTNRDGTRLRCWCGFWREVGWKTNERPLLTFVYRVNQTFVLWWEETKNKHSVNVCVIFFSTHFLLLTFYKLFTLVSVHFNRICFSSLHTCTLSWLRKEDLDPSVESVSAHQTDLWSPRLFEDDLRKFCWCDICNVVTRRLMSAACRTIS